MDVELDAEQELLRSTTARFIGSSCPMDTVRALFGDARGYDPVVFERSAELGWFAMFVDEDHGGGTVSGSPVLDAALVAEERGRAVQSGPWLSTNVFAHAVQTYGSADLRAKLLPSVVSGQLVAAWACGGLDGEWSGRSLAATADGDRLIINGTVLVQDAGSADWLLVTAHLGDELVEAVAPAESDAIEIVRLEGMDLTRRLDEVRFVNFEVDKEHVLVRSTEAADALERGLQIALVLSCADSVGALGALVDMTLQYAKDRIALGRPIGSFQAIKHRLADITLLLEGAYAVTCAAARIVEERRPEAAEVVSIAKAFVADSSTEIAQGCLQIHGGIGLTWEHDLHLFYRRLAVESMMFGDADWHRERICRLAGL